MISKKLVILIPVYKTISDLEYLEKLSIRNTLDKFGDLYQIGLLKSDKVNFASYVDFFNFQFLNIEFNFSTWVEYNALLKSNKLYQEISDFDYLLIVQTDAYVFSNSIDDFSEYDYIGAPWVRDPIKNIKGCVGNGGLSLRNIQKIKSILNSETKLFAFTTLLYMNSKHFFKFGKIKRYNGIKKFTLQQYFFIFIKSLYQYLFLNSFRNANKFDSLLEDVFYGVLVASKFENFIVPDFSRAQKFSFDENPQYFFQLNNHELPLGCHGFIKNYSQFWNKYIRE